jgi:hypothetical protein
LQKTTRTWLVNCLRITKGQAAEYKAIQALSAKHEALAAGLRDRVLTKSAALLVARWTRAIPERIPDQGRGDPRRRRPGRSGPADASGDLRPDPRMHRIPRPRR